MAKIIRPNKNVKAFASEYQGTERTTFDTGNFSDDLTDNLNTGYERGFGVYNDIDFPTLEDFNALGFTATQLASYIYQMGVPEWNSAQEYHNGSFATFNGVIYTSVQNTNIGNNPEDSDPSGFGFWVENDTITVSGSGPTSIGTISMDSEYVVEVKEPDLFVLLKFDRTTNTLSQVNAIPDAAGIPVDTSVRVCRVSERRICLAGNTNMYMIDFDELGNFTRIGNAFALGLTAGTQVKIASIAGPNLAPDTSDYVVLYSEDNGDIRLYEFDGTDFIYRGIRYSDPLSGNVELASIDAAGQSIAVLNSGSSEIIKLTYSAAQIFDIEGTTTTSGFVVTPQKLTSGFDASLTAISSDGRTVALDAAGSQITETGTVIQLNASLTGSAMLDKNVLITYDDLSFEASSYLSQKGSTGIQFWRILSSLGIGFSSVDTALQATNVQDAIKEIVQEVIYNVGSLYINANNTDPSVKLGFGTWQRIEGKFIIGVDVNDPLLDTAGLTGGAKDFNVEEHVLTENELPVHTHNIELQYQGNNKSSEGSAYATEAEVAQGDFEGTDTRQTTSVGAGEGHSHSITGYLPPYETMYVWVRVS